MKLQLNRIILSLAIAAVLTGSGLGGPLSNASVEAAHKKKHNDTVLQVKFNDGSGVELTKNGFADSSGQPLDSLNNLLNKRKLAKQARLFTADKSKIYASRHSAQIKSGKHIADLNGYYRLSFDSGTDLNSVINDLRATGLISEAYAEPLAVPSPDVNTIPDFLINQKYLNDSTNGMSINSGSGFPGAKAGNVKIADVEYSWNTDHEDISKARAADAKINNGTPADYFNDNNHGTSVTGVLSGDVNTHGINGISPDAKLHLVNTYSSGGGWNVANAVYLASANLNAGDVMLIEQQAIGPYGNDYVPVEWIPSVYDAISLATAKGIIVIEPAGNGRANIGVNLNDTAYGSSFPQGKADSGAIMVGAGGACGTSTPDRARLSFSNYGSRVNVQGSGECVATTGGYNNLYTGTGPNQWYTSSFNGTSSASALVAGVAASISSSYEQLNSAPPTIQQIRTMLMSSGQTQNTTVNPGNIGPLPNLVNAQKQLDKLAPTAPTSLTAAINSNKKVVLNWKASTDNVAVTKYRIYRNNSLLTTVNNVTSFTDTSVTRRNTYSYKLVALDSAGNVSAYSNSVSVTTPR